MPGRKTITARFHKREKLLVNFERRGRRGLLFVETGRRLQLAEQVVVEVEFPSEKRTFRLHGKVVARRRASREPPLPPGVQVEFPTEEDQALRLILDHAQGKEVAFVDRGSRRMSCSLEVAYRRDEDFIREFAEDISEGGTFIRSNNILAVGTEVECRLKPPGYLIGIKVRGKVAWVLKSGPTKGMGLQFVFESEKQRRKVKSLIKKLANKQTRN
jgi:uncharacterized protein (TIGR02266 family)